MCAIVREVAVCALSAWFITPHFHTVSSLKVLNMNSSDNVNDITAARPFGQVRPRGARGRDIKLSISTEHCATESLNVEDFYAAPCVWCAATGEYTVKGT